jgi:signal transduction histidine kinase
MVVDSEGRLYDASGQSPIPMSITPEPSPLELDRLTTEQALAWQAARDAEFQNGDLAASLQSIEAFLALAPPQPFEARARYSLALMQSRSGDGSADKAFAALEALPDAVTENGVPIRILAAWKRIELGHAVSPADIARLCSNTLARPCLYTPLILKSLETIEARTGGASHHGAEALLQWEMEQSRRELLFENPGIASNTLSIKSRWFPWRGEQWLAMAAPTPSRSTAATSTNNADPAPPRYHLHVFSESLLREAAWELVVRSRTGLPPYAGVEIQILGHPLLEATSTRPTLAETTTDWRVNETQAPGLHVRVVLRDAGSLLAQQHRRSWLMASIILASALAAGVGFTRAYHAFRQQLRLNELKSNFVSAVSHELRAPIASVRLLAEGLDRGKITAVDKQKSYFRLIVQECRRLSALIENVLDFSRIEQGRKKYEFEPSDMLALAGQTVELLTPNAQERQVRLQLDTSRFPTDNPPFVCDGPAIQQALVNLIDNAIKHSPAGAEITVGLSLEADHSLRLWVRDQGPGIPRSEHERIFERFYRLGSELRRETQGVGIGLAIVKHIVEGHGGHARVESEPGHGSCFTLELPPQPANAPPTKPH